jgi:excisionase family DNA binding protein
MRRQPVAATPQVPASPTIASLPRLLNVKEVAHVLHISVRTVHRLVANRHLTYFRVRGQLRFDPAHVSDFLSKRMVKAR